MEKGVSQLAGPNEFREKINGRWTFWKKVGCDSWRLQDAERRVARGLSTEVQTRYNLVERQLFI